MSQPLMKNSFAHLKNRRVGLALFVGLVLYIGAVIVFIIVY